MTTQASFYNCKIRLFIAHVSKRNDKERQRSKYVKDVQLGLGEGEEVRLPRSYTVYEVTRE